mgnify:CR=1 FL=1
MLKSDAKDDQLILAWVLIIFIFVSVAAHWFFNYGVNILKLLRSKERNYISTNFYIKQMAHLSIYITGLEFSNPSTGCIHKVNTGDFKYFNKNFDKPILVSNLLLSRNTNSFKFSWYSFTDGKYYTDEFPFSLTRYKLIPDYERAYDITDGNVNKYFIDKYSFFMPKKIKSLTLLMKDQGDIDLLQSGNERYVFYKKVLTEDRSEKDFNDNEEIYNDMLVKSVHEDGDY